MKAMVFAKCAAAICWLHVSEKQSPFMSEVSTKRERRPDSKHVVSKMCCANLGVVHFDSGPESFALGKLALGKLALGKLALGNLALASLTLANIALGSLAALYFALLLGLPEEGGRAVADCRKVVAAIFRHGLGKHPLCKNVDSYSSYRQ